LPWPPNRVAHSAVGTIALVVSVVASAYLNAFSGAFQFDDYNVIVNNPAVHSWSTWLSSMPGIRPLLKLSYTLNWTSGFGLFGFHLVNLLCHAGNAVCVYLLCRLWMKASGRGGEWNLQIAVTAAVFFALHPAQTEAVTYVSGRSVSLMALCYLGAMVAHLRAEERRDGLWRDALSPLLFATALLSKETAWTLPFALLLLDVGRDRSDWRRALWRLRAHWAVLGVSLGAMLSVEGYRRLALGSITARTLKENLLTQIGGQFYLLTQPLLLLRTNIDPDLPAVGSLNIDLAAKAAVLGALLLMGALQMRRRPWLGIGILWFFLHLLPTNSLLPRLDVANDRQLYLAMIGPAALLAGILRFGVPRPAAVALTLILAHGLGLATIARNRDYRTEIALWQATVQSSPHKARAWNNLGYAYQTAGEVRAARESYTRALAIDPSHPKALFNAASLPPLDTVHDPR
jgi:hypothetical protein